MEKGSEIKAVIKSVDMSEEMQEAAIEIATEAIEKFTFEKDIAASLKKQFDQKYGLTWHCVVGRSFGSFVTHESKFFIYFYLGPTAILLFRTS
ncbi:Dynein light chain [Entomophthora muscae]|uniref:Dynein light chain n=2 Tax=Entomophthora muscae TaxID=34485 RepID=A0ACC2UQT2_9FUNG|nr:Dynein light chain [Entomophthora muscae]KAJ9090176.1 Dynein light chain [Entomophthora muscae]